MSLASTLGPYVRLALECVHREYPNQISHRLESDADLKPPRELHPAFYGCYDWHSAVHGHWLLARALHLCPDAPFAEEASGALEANLRPTAIAGELTYLRARPSFERPYGLAWLLQLDAELHEMGSPHAATLAPLAELGRDHLAGWLPKLDHPVRSGTHSQTAFALGLALDWARLRGDGELEALIVERAGRYYGEDRAYSLALEPSGEDFLSPAFGAADLMRRVLPPEELAEWLGRALPTIPVSGVASPFGWWTPAKPSDPTDGRLAHLDGLNLSRAFMLDGVASALPDGDERIEALVEARDLHQDHGLTGASFHSYSGAHWLGTFATYLLTKRGGLPCG